MLDQTVKVTGIGGLWQCALPLCGCQKTLTTEQENNGSFHVHSEFDAFLKDLFAAVLDITVRTLPMQVTAYLVTKCRYGGNPVVVH